MFILIISGKTFRHSGDIPSYMDVHVVYVANTFFFHSHFPSLSYVYPLYCIYLYHSQVSCRVGVVLMLTVGTRVWPDLKR